MEVPFTHPTYTYRVKEVLRVVDGDTIDVLIDVGFKTYLSKRLRLLGIDTWEIRGEERDRGLIAKARMEELLAHADEIFVETKMDAEGKYGRVLAWVWTKKGLDMVNVNERLLLEGHGTAA